MIPAEEFETALRSFVAAPVGHAGGGSDDGTVAEPTVPGKSSGPVPVPFAQWAETATGEDASLLRDALHRLSLAPDLLGGDPAGIYTFEDPILAVAAEFARRAAAVPVGSAADGRTLRNRNWVQWALAGIHAWRARGDMAWGALGGRTPRHAIEIPELPARLAVVGDAGFECAAQSRVLQSIAARHAAAPFNLGVHLGDTYFAGSEAEVLSNLLKPLKSLDIPFTSLCGNHDLYHGPAGYAATIALLGQPGRYFAIEAPGWRIACLDTSLGCERVMRNDGRLDGGQLAWLDDFLSAADGRELLLMSHHYIVSDWGAPMPSLHDQLRDRLSGKVLAWYWGHEHHLAAYRKTAFGFVGACVGNGAFLERRSARRDQADDAEWVAPGECDCYQGVKGCWPHGWLELELRADEIHEIYHLEGVGPVHQRTVQRRN